MIKIVKLKNLVKVILLLIIIIGFIFAAKNRTKASDIIKVTNSNKSYYKILVDVEESKLYLLENDELIKTYKCSGGKQSTPSPIGTWKIVSKAKWGEGFRWKFFRIKCTMGYVSGYMEH